MLKKKENKLIIFITTIILIITSVFTILGYCETKQNYQDNTFANQRLNSIYDSLYLYNSNSDDDVIGISSNYQFPYTSLAFNKQKKPIILDDKNLYFSTETNDYIISSEKFNYETLKKIALQLEELTKNSDNINVTYNYDAISNDNVYYCQELQYFAIDDTVYLNENDRQIVTKKLTYLANSLIYCQFNNENNTYDPAISIDEFQYMEEFFNKVMKENKLKNGYYEETNSKDNPHINDVYYNDDNEDVKIECTYHIQELSGKYSKLKGRLADEKYTYDEDTQGYLVWYTNNLNNLSFASLYHFTDYLTDHFYNYLIALACIIVSSLVIKKMLAVKKEPPQIIETEVDIPLPPKDSVAIEPILTKLIESNHNLFIFKKIKVDYQPHPTILYGDKEIITELIKQLFSYVINATSSGANINILSKEHSINFTTTNTFNLSKDKQGIKDMIEQCQLQASFSEHNISIEATKDETQ